MKVVFVNSEYSGPGGIGTYISSVSRALSENGHDVHVVIKECFAGFPKSDGVTYHVLQRDHLPNRILRWAGYKFFWEMNLHCEYALGVARTLDSLCRTLSIDIIEIPEFFGEGYYWHRQGNVPYVCRLHTPWYMVRKWNELKSGISDLFIDYMEKKTAQMAAGISSPSESLAKTVRRGWIKDELPRAVIPYPIEKLQSSPERPFERTIVFIGRLELRKGIDWFAEICPELLKHNDKTGIVIAGELTEKAKPCINHMVNRLDEMGLRDRCRILGPVSSDRARALMAGAEIVAVPSRYDNFPNVVLEAMSLGRCIVACKAGGIPEMVEDSKTGLLFEATEKEAGMLHKINLALSNDALRLELGVNAMKYAHKTYSFDSIANATIDFYQEVISRWKK